MARQVTFSAHAREQIRERGLSEEAIEEMVRNPDQIVPQGKRQIAQRRIRHAGREYLVRAVCEEDGDRVTVVTVYRTSRVSKYWRQE